MGACPLDPHPSGIWAKLQLFRAFLPWSAPATNVMGWECRHLGPPATRAIIAVEQHHRHTSGGWASGAKVDWAKMAAKIPSDTVFKEALLKGFNEIFLNPVSQLLGPRASELLGNYRVGSPVPYNTNIYDHRYKLANVSLDATLYPVKAKFRLTQESRVEEKLVTFLCYADSFGEWTCKWISDESVG
jgi:hypothetical protein